MQATKTADEEQAVQFVTDMDTVAANDGDSEHVEPIQSRLEKPDLLVLFVPNCGPIVPGNRPRSSKRG